MNKYFHTFRNYFIHLLVLFSYVGGSMEIMDTITEGSAIHSSTIGNQV